MIATNDYIATNVPSAAVGVLAKYGLQPISNAESDIATALDVLVSENGDAGLKDVLSIHPDLDDILHYFGGQTTAITPTNTNTAVLAPQSVPRGETPGGNYLNPGYGGSGSMGMMGMGMGLDPLRDYRHSGTSSQMFGSSHMNGIALIAGAIILGAIIMK